VILTSSHLPDGATRCGHHYVTVATCSGRYNSVELHSPLVGVTQWLASRLMAREVGSLTLPYVPIAQ